MTTEEKPKSKGRPTTIPHYAKGKPCDCMMWFSDDPQAYREAHGLKKGEESFNDSIDRARRLATQEAPAS